MTPAEKVVTIAENVPKVYKAGQDDLWLGILNDRENFSQQFKDWQLEYMRPPVKITPITKGSANQMLRGNTLLRVVESAHFDFSQLLTGTSNQEGMYYTFYGCSSLEKIEDVGIGAMNAVFSFANAFNNCTKLHTIAKLTIAESTTFSNAFNNCSSLANIEFAGIIGKSGLNFQWSPLSHDSLISIINALADKSADTSTTWTVTIGATNKAKLTSEELLMAENKGWQIQ